MAIFDQVRGGTLRNLADATLVIGDVVKTKGYFSPNDGGDATYLIVASQTADGFSDHVLPGGNVAVLQRQGNIIVEQWGMQASAIGATGFDNSATLQAIVDDISLTGGIIQFKGVRYNFESTVDIPTANNDGTGINAIIFQGAGRTKTELFTDKNIDLLTHRDYFSMRDLFLIQRGVDGGTKFTGVGLRSSGQVRFCVFENVNVWFFKFGVLWRFSLWSYFSNMSFNGNLCGIKLARNDDMEDQTNPSPPGTWNLSDGWFHNMNTFENIVFNGDKESAGGRGEIGFWGAVQGANFINVTAQNYERSGAIPNQTIPIGQVSTCIEIVGGGPTSANTFNNSIKVFYIERSFKGLKVVDNRRLTLDSWFVQGQAGGENMLEIVNSDMTVRGQTGQSPGFVNGIDATDSNVTFDKPIVAGGSSRVLTNSFLSENGIPIPETIKNVTVTASAGTGGGTITLLADADTLAYERQGSIVTVTGRVDVDTVSGLTGKFFKIDGLPFAPSNEPERSGNAAVSMHYLNAAGDAISVSAVILENEKSIRIYIDATTVAIGDEIFVSATYLTDVIS